MLKSKFKSFTEMVGLFIKAFRNFYASVVQALTFFFKSWWHLLVIALFFIVCLYYPLGAYFIHNIDKNPNFEIKPIQKSQSATIDTFAFIINREVNEKMWTPNLPFFFPSYFLDDMPNFQLGMMEAVQVSASALRGNFVFQNENDFDEALKLLNYPGTVWMFKPDNNLMPAPSSSRQYRRARLLLLQLNQSLGDGQNVFVPNAQTLALLLNYVAQNLDKSVVALQQQMREHASDVWDEKADDVFFYNQGKLYAYLLILRAVGNDYRNIIVEKECYQLWTSLIATLEAAVNIDPWFVRNADFSQSFAANHLAYLAFYSLKVQKIALDVVSSLNHFNK